MGNMQIILRLCGQDTIVTCDQSDPVAYLRAFVNLESVLTYNGLCLSDGATIGQCGLVDGSIVQVLLCLNGGRPSPNSAGLCNWHKLRAIPSFCNVTSAD